jgi:hypothetical protein
MKYYFFINSSYSTDIDTQEKTCRQKIYRLKYQKESLTDKIDIEKIICDSFDQVIDIIKPFSKLFIFSSSVICEKNQIEKYNQLLIMKNIQIIECMSKDFMSLSEIQRRKNISETLKKKNKRINPPYGYDLMDNQLVVNESEKRIVDKILNMHQNGKSISEIKKQLISEDVIMRKSKDIHYMNIKRIIDRS